MKDTSKHPCFNIEAKGKYGRVHLPVAPKCNIQCNYCNRKYDCVNESRPGVTSALLTPKKALAYVEEVKKIEPRITVVGIAGPGDPFANAEETMESIRLINEKFPDMIFCLSTNGLNLYDYIDELAEVGVSHVTLTINAIDPAITAKIYSWVRYKKRVLHKEAGAQAILDEQLRCITKLKEKNIIVKVNSIIIPGVNDHHIPEVAKKVSELGADIFNCIPLIPTEETLFADKDKPPKEMIEAVREGSKDYIPQMTHCKRCRADAVGLLGKDNDMCMEKLQTIAFPKPSDDKDRPYVAVATHEGLLVNLHLGDADEIHIFKEIDDKYKLHEKRKAPKPGGGDTRWKDLADSLSDCNALLVSGVGPSPLKVLKNSELNVIEMSGLINEGLNHIYKGTELKTVKKRDMFKCGSACSGNGLGCG